MTGSIATARLEPIAVAIVSELLFPTRRTTGSLRVFGSGGKSTELIIRKTLIPFFS